jgi:hypothetical protein
MATKVDMCHLPAVGCGLQHWTISAAEGHHPALMSPASGLSAVRHPPVAASGSA